MACTKNDIIEKISVKNDFKPGKSKEVVETFLEIIKETLASGEDIMISGFGKFQVTEKNPRKGRNPATNEEMMLPGRKVVTFKSSSKLRNKVNQN